MKRLIMLMAAVVPLSVALVPLASGATTRAGGSAAARSCSAVTVSAPTGAQVESVTAVAHQGGTVTLPDAPITAVPAWCDITVTLTHPGAGDHVNVKVSLPGAPPF